MVLYRARAPLRRIPLRECRSGHTCIDNHRRGTDAAEFWKLLPHKGLRELMLSGASSVCPTSDTTIPGSWGIIWTRSGMY